MIRVVQVLGEPATGKTTLMRSILAELGPADGEVKNNIGPDGRHFNYARGTRYPRSRAIVMGIYDGKRTDGTDRLGLNTQPPMIQLLTMLAQDSEYDEWTVLIEGDRFANLSFVRALRAICPAAYVMLTATQSVLNARHIGRGDTQTEVWLAGRRTKMQSLLSETDPLILLSASMTHLLKNAHTLLHLIGDCNCETPPHADPPIAFTARERGA